MNSAGIKIKAVATMFLIIDIVGSVIGGIIYAVIIGKSGSPGLAVGVFAGIAIGGSLASYFIYVFMDGFGELVDRAISIDLKLKNQNEIKNNNEPRKQKNVNGSPVIESSSCVLCKRSDVPLKSVKIKYNGQITEAKICSDCYAKKMAEKK